MQVRKLNVKTKCEMPLCKNLAAYQFTVAGGDRLNSLNLCENCMRELYGHIGKLIKPESPKSVMNKQRDGDRE